MPENTQPQQPDRQDVELGEQDLDSVAGGKIVFRLPIDPIECPFPIEPIIRPIEPIYPIDPLLS